jgi:hypothetical protein
MRTSIYLCAAAAALGASVSCGDVVRTGRSPVFVTVNSITAGAPPSGVLLSDVIRLVTSPAPCSAAAPCATVFNDSGTATLSVSMKDVAVSPTTNNQVTITRYHVEYTRADGRAMPGVDVPYAFDGGTAATITPGQTGVVPFELVRHISKEETPLVQLITSSNFIATIATVTFYGTDAVGNAVAASGKITVNFGNFGDQ